jgi:chorismate synthase
MLRYLTAGESHGKALMAVLEGLPSGLKVAREKIDAELARRQAGYGRGVRMQIEKDKVEIICGLHKGITIGSPLGMLIENKDFSIDSMPAVIHPRPGHADLAGVLKYGLDDCRSVLERASARETAIRVALGAVCKMLLSEFEISVNSMVSTVGGKVGSEAIRKIIDEAREKKDTLGGVFEIVISGVPAGLGSHAQPDERLNSRLAQAMTSIAGIKAVEFGLGFMSANRFGSEVHDAIYYSKAKGYHRKTNNAGGIEGGISNGEDIVIRGYMKPIATLGRPLASVDIKTKKPHPASIQRADICAVEAAAVVAEGVCAFEIAKAVLEKFGSDCLKDIKQTFRVYLKRISQ